MTFTIHDADLAPSTAESSTSTTTLAFSPTSAVPVDKLAVLVCVFDNPDGTNADDTSKMAVSDNRGNGWNKGYESSFSPGGVAEDGCANGIYYSVITTQIEVTDTITVTFSAAITFKGCTLATFNRDPAQSIAVAGAAAERVNGTAYTVTVGSLTSEPHLWIGQNGMERTPTDTNGVDPSWAGTPLTQGGGSNWGAGSGTSAAIGARAAYLIETSTTQTYDNTTLGGADRCTVLVAFREFTPGGGGTVADPFGMSGFFGG